MNRIAVIIPFRKNPNREDRVPKLCVKTWAADPLVNAVIFIDGSSEPLELETNDKVIDIHVPYEGNFNLSFMRNVGLRRASDLGFAYVQIMDSDMFPQSNKYLSQCLVGMRYVDMLKPFVVNSKISVPENDEEYARFLNPDLDEDIRKIYSYSTMFMKLYVPKKIHGYDESYEVWGGQKMMTF